MILSHGSDIYALCETHLRNDNVLSVEGYQWFGRNRHESEISRQAWRGSGGVGFLVSENLLRRYGASVIDASTEGILWLKLSSKKDSDMGMLLCVCYLPPEGSSTGNNAQEFYDSLLAQLYMYSDGKPVLISGDVNARTGTKQDWPNDTSIRPRVSILPSSLHVP